MKAYRSIVYGETRYHGTQKDAHHEAKASMVTHTAHIEARIELLEVQSDKEGMIFVLNGNPDIEVERTWRLTARGGLVECANGD